ncbi:MAG: cryptochrome/photolyase family protein [Armatimonadota bacterium]|nr:MAG: cryptochrome/photolyase family protein [Armatimonadota bacterium]
MSAFRCLLAERQLDSRGRRWLFVPYDQLSDRIGPLAREDPRRLGVVLVENPWKASRRPYHKQKLALIVANLRHFALEQAARGVAVRHVVTRSLYRDALRPLIVELGPVRAMTPAERELRVDLQPLADAGGVELIEHEGWLTSSDQFHTSQRRGPPWRMDAFYRHVRRMTGILMSGSKPEGGKLSFDAENRLPWKGAPQAPEPPTFASDPVKREVAELIESAFGHHPGRLDMDHLPATAADAETLWSWAKRECLPTFGPYEDAMSFSSSGLFHTRISALLNLHRLLPAEVVADVLGLDVPLASKEGFVRQVLGWREFVRHVHLATDGFRDLPEGSPPVASSPGDGGYRRWAGAPWPRTALPGEPDGGAVPSALGGDTALPPAFWGIASGLACLDCVVSDVWREGWSHHITRLTVLSNLAALLDISPREITDWFWAAYTDAYDWVVEPNVLGMGTYAVGDVITTKPYVTGAAYINRMSDYCKRCGFDPKGDCPFTDLYWAFLARHDEALRRNPRMRMPLAAMRKRSQSQHRRDARVFESLRDALLGGAHLSPSEMP